MLTAISLSKSSFKSNQFIENILINETTKKVQNKAKEIFVYILEAVYIFLKDIYQDLFTHKLIYKLPFFIFVYGFSTTFGWIETVYYIALTVFALKAYRDVRTSLETKGKLKSITDHYPLTDKNYILKNLIASLAIGPILYLTETLLMKNTKNLLSSFAFKVIDEKKLIHQAGFIGKFATFYAISISPIIKETLFRGYIQTYFTKDNQDFLKATFKTALMFAFFHFSPTSGLINIPTLITYTALGLILSLLQDQKQDLFLVSFSHIIYSLLSTINSKNNFLK
ncbi:MAG: CPBP family intramembrane metalloprotease [Parachlamydiales bacterium]|nr:CPBP family intramembrane metalloprotease [Parachlamydiales bacterium]